MEELLAFFTQQSIYVVLIIVLLIWTGIFIYLTRLDAKISRLEKLVSDDDTSTKQM